jgi:RNA polymerase sigma factor (sigma-70 family)
MYELTQADKFLIEQVRKGQEDGWRQLVERYQGRLLAFARSKTRQPSDAEDLVQESFLAFLKNLDQFRGDSSLETFLFVILRRKIIDFYRSSQMNLCLLQDSTLADDESRPGIDHFAAADPTASFYARKKEDRVHCREILADAMSLLIEKLKKSLNFRDLQIIEMIFYCQFKNKDIARILSMDEKQVALIKHRAIEQIRSNISPDQNSESDDFNDGLFSEIWQTYRLSCLKRSTIGSYLLGTLEKPWLDYVEFHLKQLGCRFCQANLDDLSQQMAGENTVTMKNRILQSTLGFLSR